MVEILDREALRNLRLLKRYTLEEVAGHMGVSTAQMSKYETGQTPMKEEFLFRLLSFYGEPIQKVIMVVEDDYRKGDVQHGGR